MHLYKFSSYWCISTTFLEKKNTKNVQLLIWGISHGTLARIVDWTKLKQIQRFRNFDFRQLLAGMFFKKTFTLRWYYVTATISSIDCKTFWHENIYLNKFSLETGFSSFSCDFDFPMWKLPVWGVLTSLFKFRRSYLYKMCLRGTPNIYSKNLRYRVLLAFVP